MQEVPAAKERTNRKRNLVAPTLPRAVQGHFCTGDPQPGEIWEDLWEAQAEHTH